MNPASLQLAQAGAQALFSLASQHGRIKGLRDSAKAKEKNINLSQSAKLKAMSDNFLQQVHDFNNAYSVAQSDARNQFVDTAGKLNMATIGMQGSSYMNEAKNVMDQQYGDMMINLMNKHKEDYRRMDLMNTNQFNTVIDDYGKQRMQNVEDLYNGVMGVYAETNKALIGAAASGAVAGYQASNSGQLPNTDTTTNPNSLENLTLGERVQRYFNSRNENWDLGGGR